MWHPDLILWLHFSCLKVSYINIRILDIPSLLPSSPNGTFSLCMCLSLIPYLLMCEPGLELNQCSNSDLFGAEPWKKIPSFSNRHLLPNSFLWKKSVASCGFIRNENKEKNKKIKNKNKINENKLLQMHKWGFIPIRSSINSTFSNFFVFLTHLLLITISDAFSQILT